MTVKITLVNLHRRVDRERFSSAKIKEFLAKHEIFLCESEDESDLLISDHFHELGIRENTLIRKMIKYGKTKKYLVLTAEPRFSLFFNEYMDWPLLPRLNILNIYTGLLTNNIWAVPSGIQLAPIESFEPINHKVVGLMSYRNNRQKWSLKHEGKELDLCYLRTQIALQGHQLGLVDIYGKGWDNKIRKGVSRSQKDYTEIKLKILKQYNFNLAFENTNFPYYCTEKIWESIQGGCLPIYYGQDNAIYEDFPKESFLDYCDFDDPKDLFEYIQVMNPDEYIKRINLCIEAFNNAVKKKQELGLWRVIWEVVAQKIIAIMK